MASTWWSKFASHETRRSSRHSRAQLAVEPLEVRKLLSISRGDMFNAAGTTWANYQGATTLQNTVAVDHPAAATAHSPVYGSLLVDHPAAATAYSPVYGSLFGANGPSYRDVQQGAVGDCWLLAGLAEVAARDPSDIQDMFTDLGTATEDGSVVELYYVRFFNDAGAPEYVTVDTELPSGGAYYDHPVNDVLWVALAEKAYAQANGAGMVTTQHVGTDSYAALAGGFGSWSLGAITGKPANDYNINPANIASAWTAGNLITIGTSNPSSSYIAGNHEYAVVGYDSSSSMPFEVFNPWGTDDSGWAPGDEGKIYGLFWANATFLSQNFTDQSFGTGTAAGLDDHGNTMAPVIVAPEVAPPMPLVLTQVPDKAPAALHHDLALDALQQHDFDLSWAA